MPNTIKITSEDQHRELTAELVHIMINLRFWQKYWKENYGFSARREKEKWEVKADELLTRLGFDEHTRLKTIKIIKE